jgi:hypothetical protein
MVNGIGGMMAEQDRPVMYGGLRQIEKRLGRDRFPVIPQYYYPCWGDMLITPQLPTVVKVGWPHAGYGKIRIRESEDFEELRTVIALDRNYIISEPFIESEYEVRIVFIAPDYYRVHRRRAMEWKVNMTGSQEREDMEMTPMYKLWCDEVRAQFGGLDIFAIDAIIAQDGRQYILEINGSCSGLPPEHMDEYLAHMRDLVAIRLREAIGVQREVDVDEDELGKDVQIVNLRNRVEELEAQNVRLERRVEAARPVAQVKESNRWGLALGILASVLIGVLLGHLVWLDGGPFTRLVRR